MNRRLKIFPLVMMILLLSACGAVETASTPVSVPMDLEPTLAVNPVKGLAPEKYRSYLGMEYPPLPDGLMQEMGMLMQGAEDHSLSLVAGADGRMLWLSEMTHLDSDGNAYWVVRDILDLSDAEDGVDLVPDGCRLNGAPDGEIFVLGKDGTVLRAWRANTTLNVFESIATSGIECQSDKALEL